MKRKFFACPSLWAFAALVLLGVFAPVLTNGNPSDPVGAPFARPVWWSFGLPQPAECSFSWGEGGAFSSSGFPVPPVFEGTAVCFEWENQPPEIFSLIGEIRANPSDEVCVLWSTPRGQFCLLRASGQSAYWLNMDARDMLFKQMLGLPLIGKGTAALFPLQGGYRLSVSGAESGSLKLSLPGGRHGLLGTDQRGRDVWALLLYGIRTSLLIGICAAAVSTLLGLGFGLAAGYIGGMTDTAIMRTVDVLMSIPTLPILMILAALWGKGLWQLVLILSIFSWMGTARSVRALVLSARESPWVEGLKALGARRSYILWRHLVPEAAPLVLANLALGVPGAVLAEAGVAFLGLSDPGMISWGRMLHEAHSFGAFTEGAWWLLLPPGLGIAALCLIFMGIGRYLEECIDPRLGGKENA
ncbi:MAG: ABC transporter permease [Pyramidobacter sp.]|nr:ABC transporter permease [Pyramidobacter sp.]